MTINSDINTALQCIEQGRAGQAEEICKNLLGTSPLNADALHYLGVAVLQQGRASQAIKFIEQAIRLDSDPRYNPVNLPVAGFSEHDTSPIVNQGIDITRLNPNCADAHYNLGLALSAEGKIDAAISAFLKALEYNPGDGSTLYNLGCLYRKQGRDQKAIGLFRKTLEADPFHAAACNNLGIVLSARGRTDEAITCFIRAVELNPVAVEAFTNLGRTYLKLRRYEKARKCFNNALAISPDDAGVHFNLGVVSKALGSISEAICSFKKAVQLKPYFAEAYNNLGNALKETGHAASAVESFRKAIKARPDYADAYVNMGVAYHVLGNSRQMLLCLKRALEINPEFAEAYNNLGNVYYGLGNFKASQDSYLKALEINPDNAEAHSNLLFSLNYDPDTSVQMLWDAAGAWWRQHGKPIANRFEHWPRQDGSRKLKIGYVSADFRQHSVSHFFLPLMSGHDSDRVEIYGYSDEKHPDAITDRIRKLAHHWRSTADMPDDAVAKRIYEDRIDILVDLAGHTAGNRLPVFARKPAPVQVTWLGYPNTTGMPVIDYRITDEIADPEGASDRYYAETLIRLPNGFLCYAPHGDTPDISRLPAFESGVVTFGSFNNLAKVNSGVISVWSQILSAVPNSRLLLKGKQLSDDALRHKFHEEFALNGISSDRIKLMATTKTIPAHLSLYSAIDIGLDPFPYNGTTTTCEALWMGVPVITLCGDRHASRVGVSILTRIGCEDLIADSQTDYVARAVELAGCFGRLERLRTGLRLQMQQSALCDPDSFGHEMEKAYRRMWQYWCSGRSTQLLTSETV